MQKRIKLKKRSFFKQSHNSCKGFNLTCKSSRGKYVLSHADRGASSAVIIAEWKDSDLRLMDRVYHLGRTLKVFLWRFFLFISGRYPSLLEIGEACSCLIACSVGRQDWTTLRGIKLFESHANRASGALCQLNLGSFFKTANNSLKFLPDNELCIVADAAVYPTRINV